MRIGFFFLLIFYNAATLVAKKIIMINYYLHMALCENGVGEVILEVFSESCKHSDE